MSRGPGRWQRALLDALDRGDPVVVADVVWDVVGREPTRSELVAARRAAYSLAFEWEAASLTGQLRLDSWGRAQTHLALTRDDDRIQRDLMAWALSVATPRGNAYGAAS